MTTPDPNAHTFATGGVVNASPVTGDTVPAYLSGGCVLFPATGEMFEYDTEAETPPTSGMRGS